MGYLEDYIAEPEIKYTDFGTRLLAMVIDNVIILILIFTVFGGFITALFVGPDEPMSGTWLFSLIFYYIIGIPLTGLLYRTLFECSKRQATPGKIVMRIIVVDENFERLSFGQSLGRNASKYISGIFLIGYLIALGNDKCRTLHDQIAGTYVIFK